MNLVIGSDHGGFEMKEWLKEKLKAEGHSVHDVGALTYDKLDDYPDFARDVAKAVAAGEFDRGIVICGSGAGASVAANKVKGVRAVLIHDAYTAAQAVEHDDVNVLCMGARVIGVELAWTITRNFLDAEFSNDDRHVRRLNKVKALEAEF